MIEFADKSLRTDHSSLPFQCGRGEFRARNECNFFIHLILDSDKLRSTHLHLSFSDDNHRVLFNTYLLTRRCERLDQVLFTFFTLSKLDQHGQRTYARLDIDPIYDKFVLKIDLSKCDQSFCCSNSRQGENTRKNCIIQVCRNVCVCLFCFLSPRIEILSPSSASHSNLTFAVSRQSYHSDRQTQLEAFKEVSSSSFFCHGSSTSDNLLRYIALA